MVVYPVLPVVSGRKVGVRLHRALLLCVTHGLLWPSASNASVTIAARGAESS